MKFSIAMKTRTRGFRDGLSVCIRMGFLTCGESRTQSGFNVEVTGFSTI